MLVFDIESDGLLDTITKVHCINIIDTATGDELRFTDHEFYQDADGNTTGVPCLRTGTIADALARLSEAPQLGGQHIVGYDIPALAVVYPSFRVRRDCVIYDTKIMSQLMYPTLRDLDFAAVRKGRLPQSFLTAGLAGTHKLESWGLRLGGQLKADFKPKDYGHTWGTMPFIQDMDDYCMQDVRTNVDILNHFLRRMDDGLTTEEALATETTTAQIIGRQERFGWLFDTPGAERLTQTLQGAKVSLEERLCSSFAPFWVRAAGKLQRPKVAGRRWISTSRGGDIRINRVDTGKTKAVTVKKTGKSSLRKVYAKEEERGYWVHTSPDAPYTAVKQAIFNPASRDHIANRLTTLFNWAPTEFTDTGKPKVDEETLDSMPYPEARLIGEYLTVDKRLGQVADGKQAWLKQVKADGRMHGSVNILGTITGRMTHFRPNVAQVPSGRKPYGHECRALFGVPRGKKLVGCDAEGLELRMLAHFMAKWDGGAYGEAVTSGTKEEGTDAHTLNQKAIGLNSRDNAKTYFYAMIYGAGDFKLGTVMVEDFDAEKRERFFAKFPPGKARDEAYSRIGKKSRKSLEEGLPALGKFIASVKKSARRGWLKGLDGRRIHVRSSHAAPNTLLQGNGALVMKIALVRMDDELQKLGLLPGEDYEFVGNIHDEVQLEVKAEHADTVGRTAADAIRQAGEHFSLRCPLAGSFDIGTSWADTH